MHRDVDQDGFYTPLSISSRAIDIFQPFGVGQNTDHGLGHGDLPSLMP
jgi:hypothetical protein